MHEWLWKVYVGKTRWAFEGVSGLIKNGKSDCAAVCRLRGRVDLQSGTQAHSRDIVRDEREVQSRG